MQTCLNNPFCPIFCASDLYIAPPVDPAMDPIEKHITWNVSISLRLLQTIVDLRNQALSFTAFSQNAPLSKKISLIPLRACEISLLSVGSVALFSLQVVELVARIACLALSRILLLALLYDWYKGDPCFTNPVSQIPPQVGYTVLVNATSLLASLYATKEMLFSRKAVVLTEVIDTASLGLAPRAINWAYNRA